MPKVSVIIPVYNVENFLPRCLDSLISQTLDDIEIICIDDGSTDSSVEIVNEYIKKDPRIKLLSQKNSGVSQARNNGMEAATGEYIGFVDSDDFIEENFFEKLYTTAKTNKADIACGEIIRENYKKSKVLIKYTEPVCVSEINSRFELAKAPESSYVWNKIYLTSKIKELDIKFIKGLFYEDMPFTADVLTKMETVVCVPNAVYHYWIHPESIIKNSKSDKARADKIFSKSYVLEKCRKYGIKLKKRDMLVCKREFYFAGIKILKVYQYMATKKLYLFGLIPILTIEEYV